MNTRKEVRGEDVENLFINMVYVIKDKTYKKGHVNVIKGSLVYILRHNIKAMSNCI